MGMRTHLQYKTVSLCNVCYKIEDGKPVVYLLGRDPSSKSRIVTPVEGFRPYFYVGRDHFYSYMFKRLKNDSAIAGYSETDVKSLLENRDLIKVYTGIPDQVRDVRTRYFEVDTYEADVLFRLRYLIDSGIKCGYRIIDNEIVPDNSVPSVYRKLYVDIETYSDTFPSILNAEHKIIAVGCSDSYSDTYLVLYTGKTGSPDLSSVLIDKSSSVMLIPCRSERALLSRFFSYVKSTDPDIIVSFSDFDMLYVFHRARRLRVPYKKASSLDCVKLGLNSVRIEGREILDLAKLYRIAYGTPQWETLEDICEQELGYTGLHHDKKVFDMWNSNWIQVLERNLRDVELTRLLDEELGIIDYFFDLIRRTVGCNFSDTLYPSKIGDLCYLRKARESNVALPTKRFYEHRDYEGGLVLDPVVGVHFGIAVLDFSELYPSIISAFNISYETMDPFGNGDINIDGKYSYRSEPRGWTPTLLDEIRKLRRPLKQRLKDPSLKGKERLRIKRRSDALKHIINSFYGIYGYSGNASNRVPASRLYNPKIAESITYLGRELLKAVKGYFESKGYRVIAGDTDSVFVDLKTDDLLGEATMLSSEVSKYLKDHIKSRWGRDTGEIVLDVDNVFESLIMVTKKRYRGKTVDGSMVTKGLEIIRKNESELTKQIQEKVSEMMLEGKGKEEISSYVKSVLDSIRSLSLDQVAIPVKLSKPVEEYAVCSEHVNAYLKAVKCDIELRANNRFYMLPLQKDPRDTIMFKGSKKIVKAIGFSSVDQLPDEILDRIDYDRIIDREVKGKVEEMIRIIGLDWDRDIVGVNVLDRWI